jgi:hypothetical protein
MSNRPAPRAGEDNEEEVTVATLNEGPQLHLSRAGGRTAKVSVCIEFGTTDTGSGMGSVTVVLDEDYVREQFQTLFDSEVGHYSVAEDSPGSKRLVQRGGRTQGIMFTADMAQRVVSALNAERGA